MPRRWIDHPDPPAERHHLIRLPAGGGSLERTRLGDPEFPASWEKYRQFCSFRPPSATKGSKFVNNLNVLPSNSLRIRTGNFLRPYRELNWAIRELSDLIRESRSFNIWEVGSASRRRGDRAAAPYRVLPDGASPSSSTIQLRCHRRLRIMTPRLEGVVDGARNRGIVRLSPAPFTPEGLRDVGQVRSPASFWQLMPLCERPSKKTS